MKQLERILVPVDFSPHSKIAMNHALDLAEQFKATLELLYVWVPPSYLGPELTLGIPGFTPLSLEQYARQQATKDMEAFAQEYRGRKVQMETVIDVGRPGATILRHASSAGLVVMGTHGLTGLDRLILGSVAQEVVAKAPCPVLTVKMPETKKR